MVNKKIVIHGGNIDIQVPEDHISSRLYEVLKKTGWKKKKLADVARVTARTVSRWFKDQSKPEIDTLKRISNESGISLLFLEKGIGPLNQDALFAHYAKEKWTAGLEKQIYARIDEILQATGLNKPKLAALADIYENIFINDEKWIGGGKFKIDPFTVDKIAKCTGYNFDWIWYGIGKRLVEQKNKQNNKVAATIKPGNDRQLTNLSNQSKRPTLNDSSLIEIVQWMDEYFSNYPHQSPEFSRDLADRWPEFRKFLEKKRKSGNYMDTQQHKVSANGEK